MSSSSRCPVKPYLVCSAPLMPRFSVFLTMSYSNTGKPVTAAIATRVRANNAGMMYKRPAQCISASVSSFFCGLPNRQRMMFMSATATLYSDDRLSRFTAPNHRPNPRSSPPRQKPTPMMPATRSNVNISSHMRPCPSLSPGFSSGARLANPAAIHLCQSERLGLFSRTRGR
jgi:hypothetical protein